MSRPYLLFAPIGQTPAVLTEFVYQTFKNEGSMPQRVFVPTTTHGEATLLATLLGDGSKLEAGSRTVVRNAWADLCAALDRPVPPIEIQVIRDAAQEPLYDIRDGQQDQAFAALAYREMRELTLDPDGFRVYALLSGGRKTMSAHIMNAFSALARKQDRLFHILAGSPEMEKPDFFFPSNDETQKLHLIEVEVPRLRGLLRTSLYREGAFPEELKEFKNTMDAYRYADIAPERIVLQIEADGKIFINALDDKGLSMFDEESTVTLSWSRAATLLVVLNEMLGIEDRMVYPHKLLPKEGQSPEHTPAHLARLFYSNKWDKKVRRPWKVQYDISNSLYQVKEVLEQSFLLKHYLLPDQQKSNKATWAFPQTVVPIEVLLTRPMRSLQDQWAKHFPNLPLRVQA